MIENLTYLADAAELRPLYRLPSDLVRSKQISRLEAHCRNFIARSPLVLIGSAHPAGGLDVSPRGDPPGFMRVIDDSHLVIPDRPGNNRLDTFENLLANPAIGLLCLIPGIEIALRINGTARLTRTPELLEAMTVDGKVPKLAIVVTVTEAFLHCAKALRRARLWADDYRVEAGALPSLGQMLVEQAQSSRLTIAEADTRIEADYRNNMY